MDVESDNETLHSDDDSAHGDSGSVIDGNIEAFYSDYDSDRGDNDIDSDSGEKPSYLDGASARGDSDIERDGDIYGDIVSGDKAKPDVDLTAEQPDFRRLDTDNVAKSRDLQDTAALLVSIRNDFDAELSSGNHDTTVNEAINNALAFLGALQAAVQAAVELGGSGTIFYLLFRSREDKVRNMGWQARSCKDLAETKVELAKLMKNGVTELVYEVWDARALAQLHLEGRNLGEVLDLTEKRGVPIAQRFDSNDRKMRVLDVNQSWTADLKLWTSVNKKAFSSSPDQALRSSWLWNRGGRRSASYCMSFVHVVAVLKAGEWVRANLRTDDSAQKAIKRSGRTSPSGSSEPGVAAAETYISIGIFGVHYPSRDDVSLTRKMWAKLAARRGVKAVKPPPELMKPMSQDKAKKLVTRLWEDFPNAFGFETKKELQKELVELLVEGKPVCLYQLERKPPAEPQDANGAAVAAGPPVPAVGAEPEGVDLGEGKRFDPKKCLANRVFARKATLEDYFLKGYQHVVRKRGAGHVFVDVHLRLLLTSWLDKRFHGAFSRHTAGERPSFSVWHSLTSDGFFWLAGPLMNSSGRVCAPVVMSAIAHSCGPSNPQEKGGGVGARLTHSLKWEINSSWTQAELVQLKAAVDR
jgi:hypothetical protein